MYNVDISINQFYFIWCLHDLGWRYKQIQPLSSTLQVVTILSVHHRYSGLLTINATVYLYTDSAQHKGPATTVRVHEDDQWIKENKVSLESVFIICLHLHAVAHPITMTSDIVPIFLLSHGHRTILQQHHLKELLQN